MDKIRELFLSISERLTALARGNAVVAKPLSVGDRHIVPLCELSLAFGGGGGGGEGPESGPEAGGGTGGLSGGAAKASPVAILVVDDGKVRLERVGR